MSATSVCSGTAATESPVRLNRTCSACRQRKVKCTPLAQEWGAAAVNKCTRCWKNSLNCVFPPPARKKTRRRNEDKIRDLESRLEAVQAVVESGMGLQSPPDGDTASSLATLDEKLPQIDSNGKLDAQFKNPVTDGSVSPDLAEELYHTFINDLAPLYPLVAVPKSSTWQQIQKDRPALFRAMITAASISAQPAISAKLFRDTAQLLAENVVVAGEKSLDLIQALLVLSTWHMPPSTFAELKFSQYAHMAATMVTDLRSSNDKRYAILTPNESSLASHQLVEICRTFLATYLLCSSVAMSYRRPTSLPWGPWAEECVRGLEASPDLCLNDRRLVEWVKLQRIVEQSLLAAFMDGNSSIDVSDAKTRFILRFCVEKLETWRRSVPEDVVTSTMDIHYQTVLITLHEPTLYAGHDISDFRPPYALRPLPLSQQNRADVDIHAASSLIPCILSSQALIRTFLGLPVDTILFMPVVTYTRVTYAVIVLIKCFVSAKAYTYLAEIQLETSLDQLSAISKLLGKLESVRHQTQGRIPVPAVFHLILSAIHIWCVRMLTADICPDNEDLMEPMLHLSLGDDTSFDNPIVETSTPQIRQSLGAETHPASTDGLFDRKESGFMEDIRFDTLATELLLGCSDFLDYMDQPGPFG